jgi:hypothetical protein
MAGVRSAPVFERNGKIVRDHVWVSGREEHHPEGRYYLEWYQGGSAAGKPLPASIRSPKPSAQIH